MKVQESKRTIIFGLRNPNRGLDKTGTLEDLNSIADFQVTHSTFTNLKAFVLKSSVKAINSIYSL